MKILERLNTYDFASRVNKVLSYWYTWDNYALSIIYLLFVYYLNINGYLKNDLIIYFSELLLTNINPDSSERLNVVETKSKFTEFLYNLNMTNVVNLNEVKEMFVYNRGNIERALKEQKKLLQKKSKSIRY